MSSMILYKTDFKDSGLPNQKDLRTSVGKRYSTYIKLLSTSWSALVGLVYIHNNIVYVSFSFPENRARVPLKKHVNTMRVSGQRRTRAE